MSRNWKTSRNKCRLNFAEKTTPRNLTNPRLADPTAQRRIPIVPGFSMLQWTLHCCLCTSGLSALSPDRKNSDPSEGRMNTAYSSKLLRMYSWWHTSWRFRIYLLTRAYLFMVRTHEIRESRRTLDMTRREIPVPVSFSKFSVCNRGKRLKVRRWCSKECSKTQRPGRCH